MSQLVLALYVEGGVDARFLPILIQRSVQDLLTHGGHQVLDVDEPFVLDGAIHAFPTQPNRILAAARQAAGATDCAGAAAPGAIVSAI